MPDPNSKTWNAFSDVVLSRPCLDDVAEVVLGRSRPNSAYHSHIFHAAKFWPAAAETLPIVAEILPTAAEPQPAAAESMPAAAETLPTVTEPLPAWTTTGRKALGNDRASTGNDGTMSHLDGQLPRTVGNFQDKPRITTAEKGKGTSYAQIVDNVPRTYAQVVDTTVPVDLSALPTPVWRGDIISIKLDEVELQSSIKLCRETCLLGRFSQSRGLKPFTVQDIRSKFQNLRQPKGAWNATPIGRGFFCLRFSSSAEKQRIWSMGNLIMDTGIFRLMSWVPDFNPDMQYNSNVQVWVRLHNLGQEYWTKRTLLSIASTLGVPVKVDPKTLARNLGHFARVLVDVDLTKPLQFCCLIERAETSFCIDVSYEKLPLYCTACHSIGHLTADCRRGKGKVGAHVPPPPRVPDKVAKAAPSKVKGQSVVPVKQVFRPIIPSAGLGTATGAELFVTDIVLSASGLSSGGVPIQKKISDTGFPHRVEQIQNGDLEHRQTQVLPGVASPETGVEVVISPNTGVRTLPPLIPVPFETPLQMVSSVPVVSGDSEALVEEETFTLVHKKNATNRTRSRLPKQADVLQQVITLGNLRNRPDFVSAERVQVQGADVSASTSNVDATFTPVPSNKIARRTQSKLPSQESLLAQVAKIRKLQGQTDPVVQVAGSSAENDHNVFDALYDVEDELLQYHRVMDFG